MFRYKARGVFLRALVVLSSIFIFSLIFANIKGYIRRDITVKADELEEIYKEKSQKEKQLSRLLQEIDSIYNSQASLSRKIALLKKKQEEVSALISKINKDIKTASSNIEKKQKELKETKKKLSKYIAYFYVETQTSPVLYMLDSKDMADFLDRMSVYTLIYRNYYSKIKDLIKKQEYYRGQQEKFKKQLEYLKKQQFEVNKKLADLTAQQRLLQAQIAAKRRQQASLVNEIAALSAKAEEVIARKAASQNNDEVGGGGGNGSGDSGVAPQSSNAGFYVIKDASGNVMYDNVKAPLRLVVQDNGYFKVSPTIYSGKAYLRYRGTLEFRKDTNVYVINVLPLETYLKGLGEIYSWWPKEAAKAQAVAARTYAVASFGKRASHKYDIVDNTNDQNYVGVDKEIDNWPIAVEETKGIVLKSGGHYIATYYHSASGGHTLSTQEVWGGYRSYAQARPDRFYDSASHSWKSYGEVQACYQHNGKTVITIKRDYWAYGNSRITYAWLVDLLDSAIYLKRENASRYAQDHVACLAYNNCTGNFAFGKIKNILGSQSIEAKVGTINNVVQVYDDNSTTITKNSKYTKYLKITGTKGTYTLDAQYFKLAYNLRSPGNNWIASKLYDVKKINNNDWKFYSRGFGHRVGMSQYGACGRAYKGQNFRQILQAYYSNITFATIDNRTIRVGLTKVGGNITTVSANKQFKIFDADGNLVATIPAEQKINIVRK